MAKNQTTESAQADEQVIAQISLSEYCARVSSTDKRVELIGAFFKSQVSCGATSGTETEFDAAYQLFVNQPA